MTHQNFIDRNGLIRDQADRLAGLVDAETSRIVLRWQRRFVVAGDGCLLFKFARLASFAEIPQQPVYLGLFRGHACFAADLTQPPRRDDLSLRGLRELGLDVDEHERALLFYAQGLLNWHARQGFCPACGSVTEPTLAGHGQRCMHDACGKTYYPKIDPAVIFSIENESAAEPMLLLGRKPDWEPGRRSVIAGFVEAGETLEDAVRREAVEETGLALDSVEYVGSQPWPFPDALMCAFRGRTRQSEISLNDQELERADWFNVAQLEAGVRSGALSMPYRASIAWSLIDFWYRRQTGSGLDDI